MALNPFLFDNVYDGVCCHVGGILEYQGGMWQKRRNGSICMYELVNFSDISAVQMGGNSEYSSLLKEDFMK